MMKPLDAIFIIFLLLSCQETTDDYNEHSDQKELQKVLISHFGFQSRLEGTDTAYFDIIESIEAKSYVYNTYAHPDSGITYYSFSLPADTDSLMYYGELTH